MSAHVRDMLFDYLSGEIPREQSAVIEEHLAHCAACREDLRVLREAVDLLPARGTAPSEELDELFWRSFPARVEDRIRADGQSGSSLMAGAAERISLFVHFNRVPLLAGSGALAVIAIALLLFRPAPAPETAPEAAETNAPQAIRLEPAAVKLHDYLRRSRVLLVGLSNLRTDGGTPVDLGAERRQSRELVREARDLEMHPLDPRSAKLVGNLETILIEIANSGEKHEGPDVVTIQSGIRYNNLLFRTRMTESALAAATYERSTR